MTKTKPESAIKENLLRELEDTRFELDNARARFNMATEPELIEQCVYEMNALQSRYAYFLRLIREEDDEGSGVRGQGLGVVR